MIAPRRKGRAWKCLPGVGIMAVFPSLSAFMRAVVNQWLILQAISRLNGGTLIFSVPVESEPVAYFFGEEIALGKSFVIHL